MAAYQGNIGFQEMIQVTMKATDAQQKRLDEIVNNNDWDGFKLLTKEVLGVELQ